jgi:hypothetical protein
VAASAPTCGTFRGRLPYVRLGRGVVSLLVLPGLALTNRTPSQLTVAAWGLGFRRLAGPHHLHRAAPTRHPSWREHPRSAALVLGGADDPFFPEPVLRATAAAAPDATLWLFAGCGHGLPKQRTRGMQDELVRFFRN